MASRRRFAAGPLIVVILLGACSADDSEASTPRRFDPARAAARLRDLERIDTAGQVRYGDRAGPMTGQIGYQPYRFRVRVTIPTGPAERRATFSGLGDRAWVNRGTVAASDGVPVNGPLTLVLRGVDAPSTFELPAPTGRSSWTATSMFDPARVLDEIATLGAPFVAARPATVDGSARSGLRFHVPTADVASTGLRRVTVWVDRTGLPLRLAAVTAAQGEARYDIRSGREPLLVDAPVRTTIAAGSGPVSAPDATGPYTSVTETEVGRIPIRVLAAPADHGWTCWKVESDPPFRGLAEPTPSGGSCVAPLLPDDPPEDRYAIPLTAAAETPYTLLGLLVPPGSVVEFRPFGAEPVAVTAGPTGLAVYTGPREAVLGLAVVTTPQGSLVCGPAGVDNEADFAARRDGSEPTDDLIGAPWSCLAAADARDLGR